MPSLHRPSVCAGDCDFKMELLRGNVAVQGQFQKCVRRRAELSGERAEPQQGRLCWLEGGWLEGPACCASTPLQVLASGIAVPPLALLQ